MQREQLILGHPDRADDAVQDALVEAWRDIRGLRDPEKLDTWLHQPATGPSPCIEWASAPVAP
jgi:DNA-directed RNA polymerase specialized sigma24 family protein